MITNVDIRPDYLGQVRGVAYQNYQGWNCGMVCNQVSGSIDNNVRLTCESHPGLECEGGLCAVAP